MKTPRTIQVGLVLATLLSAGCATDVTHSASTLPGRDRPALVSHEQARTLVARYRQQAMDLRTEAQRAEWEARWYAGQFGEQDRETRLRRAQARQLWAAAEEADHLAWEYRRQVPHGQVY